MTENKIKNEGGVWAFAPVDESPELVLNHWHVFELPLPELPARTRYFAGYNCTDREGRASSAIKTFDAATRRGVTESGRVYELRGHPGFEKEGEYVWRRWREINAAVNVVDVTAEISRATL